MELANRRREGVDERCWLGLHAADGSVATRERACAFTFGQRYVLSFPTLPPPLHLRIDWRRPPYPIYTADYATYVKIVTWFLDSPSPLCPFSVHRMALAGKDLGKDVGQWFGPSTAAGAIRYVLPVFGERDADICQVPRACVPRCRARSRSRRGRLAV